MFRACHARRTGDTRPDQESRIEFGPACLAIRALGRIGTDRASAIEPIERIDRATASARARRRPGPFIQPVTGATAAGSE
ncbi:hypothetical protein C7S16_3208 [Burkholderia thailandensis]|uniref:Uncharacterized protein n=1 Tax=Burkholderia thailandensis TaxID=57975 RepID=A0AAW9D4W6_BURTH|nr:hypothetical protein [Burkholderia thailandensis]MDW9257015.1 hypothetical protein [Burkholderia thailandensis]